MMHEISASSEKCRPEALWTTAILQVSHSDKALQVGEVTREGFCVYLIPETLRVTSMGAKQVGDTVNLEIETQTQVQPALNEDVQGPQRGLCLDLDGTQLCSGMLEQ